MSRIDPTYPSGAANDSLGMPLYLSGAWQFNGAFGKRQVGHRLYFNSISILGARSYYIILTGIITKFNSLSLGLAWWTSFMAV